jgi:hypothetical protein
MPLVFDARNIPPTPPALSMCNLYSITKIRTRSVGCSALPATASATSRRCLGFFPDYPAPMVRNASGERELIVMRWGMPASPRFGGPPLTNVRNITLTALERLAEAGKPLPGAREKLLRIRSRRKSCDRQEGRGVFALHDDRRYSPSPGSGPSSRATAVPSRNQSPALTTSMAT